jgi:hypothetical protein
MVGRAIRVYLAQNARNAHFTGVTNTTADIAVVPASVPGPIVGAGPARRDVGERWPSRLVATAAANRLSIRH